MSDLDEMRRRIRADLEDGQGRWRRSPLAVRVAALLLPGLLVLVVIGLALPAARPATSELASVALALAAFALAQASVLTMTARPGVSERLAQGGVVACGAALALEAAEATGTGWTMTGGCLSITVGAGIVAFVATAVVVRGTGFPARMWHRAALATSATLAAGVPTWRHCPSRDLEHLVVAHALGPALLIAALTALALWTRRRRSLLG